MADDFETNLPHKKFTRAAIAVHLEQIYQSRNRLAHNEPVLHRRLHDTMAAIEFVVHHLDANIPNRDMPLAKLLKTDIVDIKAWAAALHEQLDVYR